MRTGGGRVKITVEFLSLQLITEALGKKKIEVDFAGRLFSELLDRLAKEIANFKAVVLGDDGEMAPDILLYINGETAGRTRDEVGTRPMSDGDTVAFALLIAGG
jgi:molybdopterin converting factor small subunit